LLRDWLAYPGDNGLAIQARLIYDGIERIVTRATPRYERAEEELVDENRRPSAKTAKLIPSPFPGGRTYL